jgi:hypothetical protein
MSNEKIATADTVSSGLMCGTRSREGALAFGRFTMTCYDKDGKLKWTAEEKNLVVNVGLQYMCGAGLTSTTQITSWFIGLYGAAASNSPAAGDTLLTHGGWTEVNPYTGNRKACTFAAATNANPSVATNTASPASFAITGTQVVGGAFLCSAASGTTGTLFSAADFSAPGDRSLASGDTLNVTYTLSLAG